MLQCDYKHIVKHLEHSNKLSLCILRHYNTFLEFKKKGISLYWTTVVDAVWLLIQPAQSNILNRALSLCRSHTLTYTDLTNLVLHNVKMHLFGQLCHIKIKSYQSTKENPVNWDGCLKVELLKRSPSSQCGS